MTNADLQSLGAMLRQAREQRALTFEEVEEQTRIRVKFLQALESGDLSLLPSVAHAKGFLRNYAQFLRLDANAIIVEFSQLTGTSAPPITTSTTPPAAPPASPPPSDQSAPAFDQESAPEAPDAPPLTPYPPPPLPHRARSTYVAPEQRVGPAGPAGVPAQPARRRTYQTPPYGVAIPTPQPAPLVIQPERPQTPLSRILGSNLIIGGILAMGMVAVVIWVIVQLSAVSGDQLAQTPDARIGTPFREATTPALLFTPSSVATTPTPGGGPVVPLDRVLINIKVVERTWAKIIVDGKVVYQGQAVAGQVFQYQGQTAIQIIVGNGKAFEVNYNGQSLGVLGERGQVVDRTFTPSGQITPTPTMTITPTSTLVPTPTVPGAPAPTRKP